MSNHYLTNDSPETLREFVEHFQHHTVAPSILAEDGWNAFDICLTDGDVASIVRYAGIKKGKRFSEKHCVRLCEMLDTLLRLRHLVALGYAGEEVTESGERRFFSTPAGEAYAAGSIDDTAA